MLMILLMNVLDVKVDAKHAHKMDVHNVKVDTFTITLLVGFMNAILVVHPIYHISSTHFYVHNVLKIVTTVTLQIV